MAFYKIEDTTLINIADAIRTKIGGTSSIRVDSMASAIGALGIEENIITLVLGNGNAVDLSNVTNLSANDIIVNQVRLNNTVIWGDGSSLYTNLVNSSVSTPGGTEIYNTIGYQDGYRWSSSGKKETVDPQGRITGWIPYKHNACLRIKNFGLTKGSGYAKGGYIIYYFSNGSYSAQQIGWKTEDFYSLTLNTSTCQYFRISGYCKSTDGVTLPEPIVTLDEEIIE